MNPMSTGYWGCDLFPHGEPNSFLESVKLASSGEINWNDIDVKPYCGTRGFDSRLAFRNAARFR